MPMSPKEWYYYRNNVELTGRYRTRIQKWTHKLILQAEFTCIRVHMFDSKDTYKDTWWQDATHYNVNSLLKLDK